MILSHSWTWELLRDLTIVLGNVYETQVQHMLVPVNTDGSRIIGFGFQQCLKYDYLYCECLSLPSIFNSNPQQAYQEIGEAASLTRYPEIPRTMCTLFSLLSSTEIESLAVSQRQHGRVLFQGAFSL